MSVAVALVVGTIELGGLFGRELGAHGSFWRWLEGISINRLGFIIAGLFVATWALAVAVWHVGRIEERWAGPVGSPADGSAGG
jgi:high-affinity nickel-transport protein